MLQHRVLVILLLTLTLTVSAAPRALLHKRTGGQVQACRITMKANVPTQGQMQANTVVTERAASVEGDGFHADTSQQTAGQGFPSGQSQATYRVSAEGQMSELSSAQLNDPVNGAYVRNLALLYVPLPDGPADIGASWSTQRTLHTPKMDTPVQLPPVPLVVTCKLGAFEGDVARIDVTAKEVPGGSTPAAFTGIYRFDTVSGRVLSATLSGELKVKVAFTRVTVPVSMTLADGAN